jgi:hypothetical protein
MPMSRGQRTGQTRMTSRIDDVGHQPIQELLQLSIIR